MGERSDIVKQLMARGSKLGSDEPEDEVTMKGSELQYLAAYITELERALEPFVKIAEGERDTLVIDTHHRDFRRARAALRKLSEETGNEL